MTFQLKSGTFNMQTSFGTSQHARPFVEMTNIAMHYGGLDGTLALEDASLKINQGEFVCVVGPSGCGKSTLMRLLSGLWPSTSGGVIVGGAEVDRPLSIVGMAFQNPTLLPWRTILQNVMLPLEVVPEHRTRLRGEKKTYISKARELLALVGLESFADKMPHQLSGGMQQRASLCRALIHEPKLLMLDEPFAALDIFTREDLWAVLQDVWMVRKPTVVLVTHDLREAVFLADRVAVMSARPGRIISETAVPFERTRTRDTTYTPVFNEMVHELREQIDVARGLNRIAGAA